MTARSLGKFYFMDGDTLERCYKDSFSYDSALSIIKEEAGTHFDPLVADAFLKSVDEVTEVADRFAAREKRRRTDAKCP